MSGNGVGAEPGLVGSVGQRKAFLTLTSCFKSIQSYYFFSLFFFFPLLHTIFFSSLLQDILRFQSSVCTAVCLKLVYRARSFLLTSYEHKMADDWMCIAFSFLFYFFFLSFFFLFFSFSSSDRLHLVLLMPLFPITFVSVLKEKKKNKIALACKFEPSLSVICEILYKWLSNGVAFRCIANQCKFTNKNYFKKSMAICVLPTLWKWRRPLKQAEAAVHVTSTHPPCRASKHLISHTPCPSLLVDSHWICTSIHDISSSTLDVEVLSAKMCYVYCTHWCFS